MADAKHFDLIVIGGGPGGYVGAIRAAWLQHHVLAFPDQRLSDDDLDRFTLAMGGFGEDPFIAPIAGRQHIIAVARAADETAPIFAETWHTDWSFQARPPAGTCLYGITIPPMGGDTLFAMGCGRVIEGTMEQMWVSLDQFRKLKPHTFVYCGHEYTEANAKFAEMVLFPTPPFPLTTAIIFLTSGGNNDIIVFNGFFAKAG